MGHRDSQPAKDCRLEMYKATASLLDGDDAVSKGIATKSVQNFDWLASCLALLTTI